MTTPLLAFDMGNVLLPFDHTLACQRVAKECGLTSDAVYDLVFRSGLEEQFERGVLTSTSFAQEVSQRLKRHFTVDWLREAWSDIFSADDQMLALVDELSERNELHLVSNTNVWHFAHVTARFPVLRYFCKRTLSYEVHSFKPEANMFRCISDHVGTGRLIVYIDDIPNYVEAARALGAIGYVFSSCEKLRVDLGKLGLLGG